MEEPAPEMSVRELDDVDWLEDFENGSEHVADAVHVFEGIDEDGQPAFRRLITDVLQGTRHPVILQRHRELHLPRGLVGLRLAARLVFPHRANQM